MAAVITRGTTFTLGQQNISVATFTPLLTAATIVAIDRDNVAANLSPGTATEDKPDNMQPGEVWQDDVSGHVKTLLVLGEDPVPGYTTGVLFTLSPTSAGATSGDVLCCSQDAADDADLRMQVCTQALRFAVLGVAIDTVEPGGVGRYVLRGPVRVKCVGSVAAGEGVRVSATDGSVESVGAVGSGVGNDVMGIALGDDDGGYVWINR